MIKKFILHKKFRSEHSSSSIIEAIKRIFPPESSIFDEIREEKLKSTYNLVEKRFGQLKTFHSLKFWDQQKYDFFSINSPSASKWSKRKEELNYYSFLQF
jgi:hypothetical protein